MDDNIKQGDWINSSEAGRPTIRPKATPTIDKDVSQAVGVTVYTNNSTLIKKVAEWRRRSKDPENVSYNNNYLKDPEKVKELKQALNISI